MRLPTRRHHTTAPSPGRTKGRVQPSISSAESRRSGAYTKGTWPGYVRERPRPPAPRERGTGPRDSTYPEMPSSTLCGGPTVRHSEVSGIAPPGRGVNGRAAVAIRHDCSRPFVERSPRCCLATRGATMKMATCFRSGILGTATLVAYSLASAACGGSGEDPAGHLDSPAEVGASADAHHDGIDGADCIASGVG